MESLVRDDALPRPPASTITRRAVLAAAASLPAFGPGALADAGATAPTSDIVFSALRKGDPIGTHALRFRREGPLLRVDVEIDLLVRFAFVPVFRYTHRGAETWRDGRLVALDTRTDDNGEDFAVTARVEGDRLRVEGAHGELDLPSDIVPTSYWDPTTPLSRTLLDTQRGRALSVQTRKVGRERVALPERAADCRRFRMRGDLNLELWYTEADELAKIAFEARGAAIEYARIA